MTQTSVATKAAGKGWAISPGYNGDKPSSRRRVSLGTEKQQHESRQVSGKYSSAIRWKKVCPARSELRALGGPGRMWGGVVQWGLKGDVPRHRRLVPAPRFQNPHKPPNPPSTASSGFGCKPLSPPPTSEPPFVPSANATLRGFCPKFSTASLPFLTPSRVPCVPPHPSPLSGPLQPCCRFTAHPAAATHPVPNSSPRLFSAASSHLVTGE